MGGWTWLSERLRSTTIEVECNIQESWFLFGYQSCLFEKLYNLFSDTDNLCDHFFSEPLFHHPCTFHYLPYSKINSTLQASKFQLQNFCTITIVHDDIKTTIITPLYRY